MSQEVLSGQAQTLTLVVPRVREDHAEIVVCLGHDGNDSLTRKALEDQPKDSGPAQTSLATFLTIIHGSPL